MGGKPSKPVKQWADGPFKLIESPRHKVGKRDASKETGAFISANEMVLIHNCFLRALNCIYLQAPNVKDPVDIADFLKFMRGWSLCLHMHHETEETVVFPVIEEMIGLPGFLKVNVEQHRKFGAGMDDFDSYLKACESKRETFDPVRVRKIIDGFGEALSVHLTEEIDSLLTLEDHNEKIDWKTLDKKVLKKALDEGDTDLELPCALTNMDFHEEDGVHGSLWPPVPWHVLLIFQWWYIPKNKGAWRFSSCDDRGNPRELAFV